MRASADCSLAYSVAVWLPRHDFLFFPSQVLEEIVIDNQGDQMRQVVRLDHNPAVRRRRLETMTSYGFSCASIVCCWRPIYTSLKVIGVGLAPIAFRMRDDSCFPWYGFSALLKSARGKLFICAHDAESLICHAEQW